ncbi:hypothetical protein IC007_1828 [Sulfuracidifex tepidarius]|uniref:Uncharacterized protein n=1 Tax=Sulfuracidifex tepidarius TaxID=1294262 RepID=A0A510E440_9CREN|nr:hypothetical protein IC007_1828 [Sulfuracidifex tepidarius]
MSEETAIQDQGMKKEKKVRQTNLDEFLGMM